MNNQRQFFQQSFGLKNFSPILALYFYSLGSLFLGYSVFLIYTINSENSPTSWAGESLFWSVIVFFVAVFVLFLPVEFFSKSSVQNSGFNEMIINIVGIISISLIFLILFQTVVQIESTIISDLKFITRSVSFSGFIVMPISLFILNSINSRFKALDSYGFSVLLLIWILSSQIFL